MKGKIPFKLSNIPCENENENENEIEIVNDDILNDEFLKDIPDFIEEKGVKKKKKIKTKKVKKKLDDNEKDKLINELKEENQKLLLEIENQKLNFENLQHQVVGIDIPKTSNEYDNNTNINNDDLKKIIEKYENEIKQQKEKEENMIIEFIN